MRKSLVLLSFVVALLSCRQQSESAVIITEEIENKLWYNQPAEEWMTQALPIGNGSIGAMIFGGIEKEHIQFNEQSLWSGKPHDDSQPSFRKKIPEVMELLAKGKVVEGNDLLKEEEIPGREFFGAFQPFGDVFIEFAHQGEVTDYHRELDLSRSLATVSYKMDGINYSREYFVSYPDQVVVMRISADQPGKINVLVSKTCPHDGSNVEVEDHTDLVLQGRMPESGINYGSRLRVINQDGTITKDKKGLQISAASSVTLLLSAKTDYAMNWPSCQSDINPHEIVQNQVNAAARKTYDKLLSAHLEDYQPLFNRVSLSLESPLDRSKLPTDQRLIAYTNANAQGAKNGGDPGLEALLFHYGRYLIISSSREGSLPANLQGVWNNSKTPAWDSDYHTDINLQMNYWLTGSTNLPECFDPLADYVDFLQKPGSEIAKNYFNARGFFVQIYTNPWGYAEPRWLWPGAGGWLCQNLYDHFLFTGDVKYLEKKAFPIMKNASLFYLDLLFPYTDGSLVISPSLSPEINFIHDNGKSYRLSAGASIDQQVVHDLFTNTIEAAQILGKEDELIEILTDRLQRLSPPVKIRENGAIQEWVEDWSAEDEEHRHISHLYALYPGRLIDPVKTPQWAKAADKSLIIRGDDHVGWGSAWRIACYARLNDGEKAHDFFKSLIKRSTITTIVYRGAGGTYDNLFGSHSPFQIDGNFGFTAAVSEMLLQSHIGNWEEGYEIHLLPALPKAWSEGKIKGLIARGGLTVDMEWENGKLVKASISAKHKKTIKIRYQGKIGEFEIEKNKPLILDRELKKL
jgi:alpha-L-fucosidase 2